MKAFIKLEIDFFTSQQYTALLEREGCMGIGAVLEILRYLRMCENAIGSRRGLAIVARSCKKSTAYFEKIINNYEVFTMIDDERFYCNYLSKTLYPSTAKKATTSPRQCNADTTPLQRHANDNTTTGSEVVDNQYSLLHINNKEEKRRDKKETSSVKKNQNPQAESSNAKPTPPPISFQSQHNKQANEPVATPPPHDSTALSHDSTVSSHDSTSPSHDSTVLSDVVATLSQAIIKPLPTVGDASSPSGGVPTTPQNPATAATKATNIPTTPHKPSQTSAQTHANSHANPSTLPPKVIASPTPPVAVMPMTIPSDPPPTTERAVLNALYQDDSYMKCLQTLSGINVYQNLQIRYNCLEWFQFVRQSQGKPITDVCDAKKHLSALLKPGRNTRNDFHRFRNEMLARAAENRVSR